MGSFYGSSSNQVLIEFDSPSKFQSDLGPFQLAKTWDGTEERVEGEGKGLPVKVAGTDRGGRTPET